MLIKDRMNILEDTSNNQIPKLSFERKNIRSYNLKLENLNHRLSIIV